MAVDQTLRIDVREGVAVTAIRTAPEQALSDLVVVYAPGAGSNLRDPFGRYLAAYLSERGYEAWRFQFPYSERGKGAPDPPAVLQATWQAVIEVALKQDASAGQARRILASGRSMGGRIASVVASTGAPVAALALFAYPLIPPGRAVSDRAAHFDSIGVPVLFCSGTRDSFGTPEQLQEAAARVPGATVHFLEGADHGFSVLKASGRTREDVWREACEALSAFLEALA